MARNAIFKIKGPIDTVAKVQTGTVTINHGSNLFSVRPSRSHKSYEMRLEDVAEMVAKRTIASELKVPLAAPKRPRGKR